MTQKQNPFFKKNQSSEKKTNPITIIFWISFLVIILFIIIVSSSDSTEPTTTPLSKNHSIEVSFETQHFDNFDVLTTTKNFYNKGNLIKKQVSTDTIPSLGDTTIVGEDDNGNIKSFNRKNDYQIFVTIK